MADEPQTAPVEQDTPTPDESGLDTETPAVEPEGDVDFKERYENLRPEYTRATQELAAYQGVVEALQSDDPEQYLPILEQFNFDINALQGNDEDDLDDDLEDDDDPEMAEVRETVSELQEREQAREDDAAISGLEQHIAGLAQQHEVDLTNRQFYTLAREAIDAGMNPQQTENLFTDFVDDNRQLEQQVIEKYRDTKRAPAAPRPGGTTGTPEFDVNDPRERRKRMEQIAAEHFEGS